MSGSLLLDRGVSFGGEVGAGGLIVTLGGHPESEHGDGFWTFDIYGRRKPY